MRADPLLRMAPYIVRFVLAGIHLGVLFKNILEGDRSHLQEPRYRGVSCKECVIGDGSNIAGRHAHVARVGCTAFDVRDIGPVGILLQRLRQFCRFGLEPNDIFARLEKTNGPVWRPGIEKYGLAFLKPRDSIRHCHVVRGFYGMNGTVETVRLQLVIDQQFASPPWRARDQVGVPCSLTVEELSNLGPREILKISDTIRIGGFLVDEITLQGSSLYHVPNRTRFSPEYFLVFVMCGEITVEP